jgi:hypothetical protein
MRALSFNPFVIFSVPADELEGVVHRLELLHIRTQVVDGCYGGIEEQSVLVDGIHRDLAIDIAKSFGEEAILEVDAQRNAFFLYIDSGEKKSIGEWSKAKNGVDYLNWTQDRNTGIKWVTR